MWMMIHSGTAKVGVRLSGIIPIEVIGVAGAKMPIDVSLGEHARADRHDEVQQAA
jgi:hypothetical protein